MLERLFAAQMAAGAVVTGDGYGGNGYTKALDFQSPVNPFDAFYDHKGLSPSSDYGFPQLPRTLAFADVTGDGLFDALVGEFQVSMADVDDAGQHILDYKNRLVFYSARTSSYRPLAHLSMST